MMASHWKQHPHVTDDRSTAERVVDAMGTTRFVVIQTAVVLTWIALNLTGLAFAWDPYPFILLNLAFSTQAAYATPLLLMAGQSEARRNAQQATALYEKTAAIHDHNVSHVECDCHD
jgi:uncharacterized membrane protein